MDRPAFCQVPAGGGDQRKMEETGFEVICGASTTLANKGIGERDVEGLLVCLPMPELLTRAFH